MLLKLAVSIRGEQKASKLSSSGTEKKIPEILLLHVCRPIPVWFLYFAPRFTSNLELLLLILQSQEK